MKDIHYYFILNAGVTDGEEITHGVLRGKIEYKPGAFDPFWNRDDAVARLESEEIRKQMEELGVQRWLNRKLFSQGLLRMPDFK